MAWVLPSVAILPVSPCRRASLRPSDHGGRRADGSVALRLSAREWERASPECGCIWRVPRSIARRGIRGMSAMTVGVCPRGPMHSCARPRRASIEARAELMEGFRVCAKCGTDHFTQRPSRRSETAPADLPPPGPVSPRVTPRQSAAGRQAPPPTARSWPGAPRRAGTRRCRPPCPHSRSGRTGDPSSCQPSDG